MPNLIRLRLRSPDGTFNRTRIVLLGMDPQPQNSRLSILPLLVLAIFLLGTKECQEDYELGAQTEVAATPTPTVEDDEDGTETPTPTATPTGTISATASPTPTDSAARLAAVGIMGSLAELNRNAGAADGEEPAEPRSLEAPSSNPYTTLGRSGPGSGGNWLGRAFVNDVKDTDADGFCDWLERAFGTDVNDPRSTPPPPRTKLAHELLRDSDGDGQLDGVEAAAGSDPRDPRSVVSGDSDGDTLPDSIERRFGSDPSLVDSDRDGASDAVEFAVGSDPLNRDSDGDGILDGKEIELGSDPAIPESQAAN